MSQILSKFMDIIKGIIGEKKYLLFPFFFFCDLVTRNPDR